MGEKRFRASQTDRTAARAARRRSLAARVVTNVAICASSSIRTVTVGSGFAPDLLTPRRNGMADSTRALAGSPAHGRHTAGGEFRPALKTH
jgi:hypothetical protein